MTPVKTYPTRLEADLATIVLRAEGVLATAIDAGMAKEGHIEEARVLVPEEKVETARNVLGDT